MGTATSEAIAHLKHLMDQVEESLKRTFQNIHQGYQTESLVRFLKARDWNVNKAHKMLVDCLKWRLQNGIDSILAKPIVPDKLYREVRESQLIGMSGYSKEGLPVFAYGVGLSTLDKASAHYYIQSHIQINEYRDRIILPAASRQFGRPITNCLKVLDMSGLKISALSQIKLLTIISTVDDLNYPEKTRTYYIVNAPYVFSACWKVVKPLLQERTRKKVQVLSGNGYHELLQIMDVDSLPHFCTRNGSGSFGRSCNNDCFSLDHPFHRQLYAHVLQNAMKSDHQPVRQGSFHVGLPDPGAETNNAVMTIGTELQKYEDGSKLPASMDGLKFED